MKHRAVKTVAIVLLSLLVALLIAAACVFYQVPLDYKVSDVHRLNGNAVLLPVGHALNNYDVPVLAKVRDGAVTDEPFRIMLLTDVHLCELQTPTKKTLDRMLGWIYAEQPDLILLGGDTLNGLNDGRRVVQFAEIMQKLNVFWAPVLGNHEGDRPVLMTPRDKVAKIWSKYSRCLMESDTKHTADGTAVDGYGNYTVNIIGSDLKIKNTFFMLDNGGRPTEAQKKQWGATGKFDVAISASQVQWYNETYLRLKQQNGGTLTHMCLLHKPLREFAAAFTFDDGSYKRGSYGKECTYTVDTASGWQQVAGTLRSHVHTPSYTDGKLYDALTANGAKAVFFGHDHVSDITMYNSVHDIYLTYIRLTSTKENLPEAEGYNMLTVLSDGGYKCDACDVGGGYLWTLFENK